MNRRVFEAALRATAKITLGSQLVGAGLIGCGGTVMVQDGEGDPDFDDAPPPPPVATADDTETPERAPSPDADLDPHLTSPDPVVCAPPPGDPPEWQTFHEETFACCVTAIASLAPANPEQDWLGGAPDQASKDCCTQLISPNYPEVWSAETLPHPMPKEVLAACCVAMHGNVRCSPWGPPMPPTLSASALMRWSQLRLS